MSQYPLTITPFAWFNYDQWRALWALRHYQLAEEGVLIPLEENPEPPHNVSRDDYEWDYDHLDEIYLCGAGGFWLAWWECCPVGHIAAQDLDGIVELRHMYVRAEYRRRGIGAALVQALLDHCKAHGAKTVRLWTGEHGMGRPLYERMGFQVVIRPGKEEIAEFFKRTNFNPGEDEVRMERTLFPLVEKQYPE